VVGSIVLLIALKAGWYKFSDTDQLPPKPQAQTPQARQPYRPGPNGEPPEETPEETKAREDAARRNMASEDGMPPIITPHISVPGNSVPPNSAPQNNTRPGATLPNAAPQGAASGNNGAENRAVAKEDAGTSKPERRTWTDSTGKHKTEARLLAYGNGKVVIERENGTSKVVPLKLLSQPDHDYVTAVMPADGKPTDTELVGGDGGSKFSSDGTGPLLGIHWTTGEWDNEQCLRQVEGLYDRQSGENNVVAKDGYAVGAVKVEAGHFVDAVQLVFMRIGDDGRLDPSDSYTSEWLGFHSGGKPSVTLGGTGAIVLGVCGRGAAVVDALGLTIRGR
jgi:hypothetical protein